MCIRDRIEHRRLKPRIAGRAAIGADVEIGQRAVKQERDMACLLYTSDAADERSSVDLGGCRII